MSRFLSRRFARLEPYVPGEQPQDRKYIKLNTNESPFPPCESVVKAVREAAGTLNLYSDPDSRVLRKTLAETYGVGEENVIVTNGSDEVLSYAFMAFCDENHGVCFPDITYGFYTVYADINNVTYREIPLKEDFSIAPEEYYNAKAMVVIANPNAQTGVAMSRDSIEEIIKRNPDSVVLIDEAYVDFGGESCVPLTKKYDNLLVVQTFSKSRSLAGARLGFGIGSSALINDLNTIRNSTNPYNVNRMTSAAGTAILKEDSYTKENCRRIIENRAFTAEELKKLGFEMPESSANFILAQHEKVSGEQIYRELKDRGILVRHFSKERISNFNRITIGTREQMQCLIDNIREIIAEKNHEKS